eukprot:CAMPEP_0182437172 /NCGR_PEP_ID=MMETSP1167-20130531/84862_1 /TAXON_ID=2988 /ORGANISM="Mallomonas Sp, Strain CCMP3275" /LENGTH=1055 /DNA_ID=CAMNT_0024629987 /DNA_START=47 /DNA_END=3214 /DNA_ORIENTATION=+
MPPQNSNRGTYGSLTQIPLCQDVSQENDIERFQQCISSRSSLLKVSGKTVIGILLLAVLAILFAVGRMSSLTVTGDKFMFMEGAETPSQRLKERSSAVSFEQETPGESSEESLAIDEPYPELFHQNSPLTDAVEISDMSIDIGADLTPDAVYDMSDDWDLYGDAKMSGSSLILTSSHEGEQGVAILNKAIKDIYYKRVQIDFDLTITCGTGCADGIAVVFGRQTTVLEEKNKLTESYCPSYLICAQESEYDNYFRIKSGTYAYRNGDGKPQNLKDGKVKHITLIYEYNSFGMSFSITGDDGLSTYVADAMVYPYYYYYDYAVAIVGRTSTESAEHKIDNLSVSISNSVSGSFFDYFYSSYYDKFWAKYGAAVRKNSELQLTSSSSPYGYALLKDIYIHPLTSKRVSMEFYVKSYCNSNSNTCKGGTTVVFAPYDETAALATAASDVDTQCADHAICITLDSTGYHLKATSGKGDYIASQAIDSSAIKAILEGKMNKVRLTIDFSQGGLTASFIPYYNYGNPVNVRIKSSSLTSIISNKSYKMGFYGETESNSPSTHTVDSVKMHYDLSGDVWQYSMESSRDKAYSQEAMWQPISDAYASYGYVRLTNFYADEFGALAMTKGITNLAYATVSISFDYKIWCYAYYGCADGIVAALGPWDKVLEVDRGETDSCGEGFLCVQQSEAQGYFRIAAGGSTFTGTGTYDNNNVLSGKQMHVDIVIDCMGDGFVAKHTDSSGNVKTVTVPAQQLTQLVDNLETYSIVFWSSTGEKARSVHYLDNVMVKVTSSAPTAAPTPSVWHYTMGTNSDEMWKFAGEAKRIGNAIQLAPATKYKYGTAAMTQAIGGLDTATVYLSFDYQIECTNTYCLKDGIVAAFGPLKTLTSLYTYSSMPCRDGFICMHQYSSEAGSEVFPGEFKYSTSTISKVVSKSHVDIVWNMLGEGIVIKTTYESGNVKKIVIPPENVRNSVSEEEEYGIVFRAYNGYYAGVQKISGVTVVVNTSPFPTAQPTHFVTPEPSLISTAVPTPFSPTGQPTSAPSGESTNQPSGSPTHAPTSKPNN